MSDGEEINLMNNKHNNRYTLVVYFIVALFAIILFLIGNYYFTSGSIHDLVISLASELIGVVLLFFIINQIFFPDRKKDNSEQLDSLVSFLSSKFTVLGFEEEIQEKIKFPHKLETAQSFDFLALDASRILKDNHDNFVNAIVRGTHVRIMLLDLQSEAANLLEKRMDKYYDDGGLHNYLSRLESIEQNIIISTNVAGKFEARVYNWLPSCRIMAFNSNSTSASMMVNIYPTAFTGAQYKKRLSLFLTPELNNEWHQYFNKEFENLWESATDWKSLPHSN